MELDTDTQMIRYECESCSMTAHGVVTPAMAEAWLHHMDSHEDPSAFNAWTWSVLRLEL